MGKTAETGDAVVEPRRAAPEAVAAAVPVSASESRDQVASAATAREVATRTMVGDGTLPNVTLSADAISVESSLLNKALNATNILSFSSPDVATLSRVLGPMSQVDRQHLEKDYKEHFGREFRDDLKAKLSPTDYLAQVAILDRKDGQSNLSGLVNLSLETIKTDPVAGQRLLRSSLETLSGATLAQLDKQYKGPDGSGKGFLQTIIDNPDVSQANKDMVRVMVLGAEPRLAGAKDAYVEVDGKKYAAIGADRTQADIVAMAAIALKAQDLRMFGDAVGDQSPASRAALKQLQADPKFLAAFQDTFEKGKSDGERQLAQDLRTEGVPSLATIVQGNANVYLGLLDNPGNTDLALSNATERERRDFTRGRELIEQATKAGKTPEELATTPELRDALAYNRKIEAAFDKTLARWDDGYGIFGENERKVRDDQRRKSIWEDQLMHGGKTLISQLAETEVRDSSRHTPDQLMTITERMSKQDYDRLHGNPAELAKYQGELGRSLDAYATPAEKERILAMVAAKASAPTFDASTGIKRSVADVMEDNKSTHLFGRADTYDNDKVTSRIASMSATDAQMYKANTDGFRDRTDKFVREQLSDPSAQKYLAESTLKQIALTGKPPTLDAVQQVVKDNLDSADPATRVRDLERVLQDKALVAQLKDVEAARALGGSEVSRRMSDPAFAAAFNMSNVLRESAPYIANQNLWNMSLQDGKIGPGVKYSMGVPMTNLYEDFARGSKEIRDHASLSTDQRQILDAVVKQGGKPTLADELRSFTIGDGGDFKDFKERLSALTLGEREKLKNEYSDKYHSSLDNDYLSKVDNAHSIEYMKLLSTSKGDGVQDFVDRRTSADKSGTAADASSFTVDRAVQQNQSLLTEYSKMRQALPEDKQKILDQFFSEAKFQQVQSEQAKAELIYNATMAAAMLVAIPATAGLSAAALAALIPAAAVSGAAYRIELMKAVEGGNFDDSTRNMVRQSLLGAADGLLIAAPAALIGKGLKGAGELAPSTKAEIEAFVREIRASGGVAGTGRELVVAGSRELVPVVAGTSSREVVVAGSRELVPVVAGTAGREVVVAGSRELVPVVAGTSSREVVAAAAGTTARRGPIIIDGTWTRVGEEASKVGAAGRGLAIDEAAARAAAATALRLAGAAGHTDAIVPANKPSDAAVVPPIVKQYQPSEAMVTAATVRRGEGPWQSAERMLKADGKHHTLEEVRALTKAIQTVYGANPDNPAMSSLKVKHNFVAESSYNALINTVTDARVKALLIKFAAK